MRLSLTAMEQICILNNGRAPWTFCEVGSGLEVGYTKNNKKKEFMLKRAKPALDIRGLSH
jgi:hypothetical protein